MIDYYVKRYFDGLDITTILPFTTIQRIFNNREIRKQIGLDISDESTFTIEKMQLVIDASKWIVSEADASGIAVTRLYNKARAIEDKLLPWIQDYMKNHTGESKQGNTEDGEDSTEQKDTDRVESTGDNDSDTTGSDGDSESDGREGSGRRERNTGDIGGGNNASRDSGGSRNLPYFFQGLNYGSLNPNDAETHGVAAICRELQLFSDRRLVSAYPIASTFLVRAIIEQAIIYYSKKHNIQGQQKLIWEDIKTISKLSNIIEKYKRNLPNYITDAFMRQYFMSLFGNYEDNVDPLNWVVHRPSEFQLDASTLIELPRKGLLAIINYLLS